MGVSLSRGFPEKRGACRCSRWERSEKGEEAGGVRPAPSPLQPAPLPQLGEASSSRPCGGAGCRFRTMLLTRERACSPHPVKTVQVRAGPEVPRSSQGRGSRCRLLVRRPHCERLSVGGSCLTVLHTLLVWRFCLGCRPSRSPASTSPALCIPHSVLPQLMGKKVPLGSRGQKGQTN